MEDNLSEIIKNYSPSGEVIELARSASIVLMCGITGAGKDSLKQELISRDIFTRIITSTTRLPRENDGIMERHGREYYFFTTEEAIDNIHSKRYFEVALVHERINGVTAEEIERLKGGQLTAIGDVDYQGVDYFHKYSPSTMAIFIVPPSYDEWISRLKKRYKNDQEFLLEWPARRESTIKEINWALSKDNLAFIVNDSLDKAAAETESTILGKVNDTAVGRLRAKEILKRLVDSGTRVE